MTRSILPIACLIGALCTPGANSQQINQAENSEEAAAHSSAIAYVYVSSMPANGNVSHIEAFTADKNGRLKPVSGSPFSGDVGSMAVNGSHLFGANAKTPEVDSYTIESNGGLRYTASENYAQFNLDDCGTAGSVFLDRTGSSLYVMEYDGQGCANNTYQSFAVKESSGALTNVGKGAVNAWLSGPASFIGNNEYAYSASCLGNMYWGIFGFKRESNGLLKEIDIQAPTPEAKQGDFYCPSQAAADRKDHVAVAMQAVNGQTFGSDGAAQLAAYKADGSGNLSTTNTATNMPRVAVGSVTDLKMDPSGELLAVSGSGGLQVFRFHSSEPITAFTGLLTRNAVDQMFWDSSSHLYAISNKAGKLYVFTVTMTGAKEASGSPYSISQPQSLVVQPLS